VQKKRILQQMKDAHLVGEDFASLNRETSTALRHVCDRLCESNTLDVDTALGYLQYLLWNTLNIWETSDLRGK
jgi:hypothetical protein